MSYMYTGSRLLVWVLSSGDGEREGERGRGREGGGEREGEREGESPSRARCVRILYMYQLVL